MSVLLQSPTTVHGAAGLSADGSALHDGAAREALRQAMHQLSAAETTAGSARAPAMCQALTETAQALAALQAYSPAESHLAQALRWAGQMGGVDLRADLFCALAEVATSAGDLAEAEGEIARSRAARDRARDHAFESARLAGLVTDPTWELRVLLRASDVLDRCGDRDDALRLQQRVLVLMGMGHGGLGAEDRWASASATDLNEDSVQPAPGGLM